MAAASFYKFVNPRGVRPTGGTATIAGKKYKTKPDGTPRLQVLALNRIGGQLNEQTKILQGIKLSVDNSTKGLIKNNKLINDSIKGLASEDRKRKIATTKQQRKASRESRIAASRARLGGREGGLEAKRAGPATDGSTDTSPEGGGGFFAGIIKFLKTLVLYGALSWLSNPKNAKMAVDFLKVLVKVGKAIYKFVEFGVINALEGFSNMFGSDSSLLDRLKGFLQFAVGIFSLFLVNRYLKNPFKIIKDVKRVFRGLRLIPKALGLAAKAGKALVMATKAGVARMKGGGIKGIVATTAITALAGGAIMMSGGGEEESTTASATNSGGTSGTTASPTTKTGGTSGTTATAVPKAESGAILPFRTGGRPPHAQSGAARVITGRNQGYRAKVGGGAIEAHGTEAVVPIKNRYTDSGNDPLAAVLGNSKKMAKGMATLIPMPLKMAGAGILVGLGALLGKLPFGIGNMLGPIAKTLMGPILQIFGVDGNILDKAMGLSTSNNQAGKDFAEAMTDAIKDWFKSILPGGSTPTPTPTPPGATPPGAAREYAGPAFGPNGEKTATPPAGSTGTWGPLLDLIAGKESGGNYEAMNPNKTLPGATKMTISEVAKKATGAVGKYQQLPQNLVGRARRIGLDPDKDLYNEANQDKLIMESNIEGSRKGAQWLAGKMSTEDFMQGLSQEFASFPNAAGKFHYPGQSSSMTPEKIKEALKKIKPQRMFLGGIAKGIGNAFGGIGKTIAKIAPIAASFIPGIGPIASAAIGGISGLLGGGGIGGALSGALGSIGGFGGLGDMIGGGFGGLMSSAGGMLDGAFSGLMSGDILGGMGGMGNILAQGGEMIFGPGFTSMFGGTLDALNIGGKGLGASSFLKQAGMGALDFAVGQIAGTAGGPDSKQAMVPGGSTVLNVNAAKTFSTLMKTQQVAQNSAKIQNLEGATTALTDKLVKVTSDVIAGVLVDKGKMAELPPAINDQAMAQILPMIQQAIISASQKGAQSGGGAPNPGFKKSSSGENLTSTIAGSLSSIAGKILGGGIK